MSQLRFLTDEHTPTWWLPALLKDEPAIWIDRVGSDNMPPLGITDQGVLQYCLENGYAWLTCDKKYLHQEILLFLQTHETYPPVFSLTGNWTTEAIVNELILLWSCSTAEEWMGQTKRLPI